MVGLCGTKILDLTCSVRHHQAKHRHLSLNFRETELDGPLRSLLALVVYGSLILFLYSQSRKQLAPQMAFLVLCVIDKSFIHFFYPIQENILPLWKADLTKSYSVHWFSIYRDHFWKPQTSTHFPMSFRKYQYLCKTFAHPCLSNATEENTSICNIFSLPHNPK